MILAILCYLVYSSLHLCIFVLCLKCWRWQTHTYIYKYTNKFSSITPVFIYLLTYLEISIKLKSKTLAAFPHIDMKFHLGNTATFQKALLLHSYSQDVTLTFFSSQFAIHARIHSSVYMLLYQCFALQTYSRTFFP